MAKIIRLHETGGPDVLQIEEIDIPPPPPGQVTIAVKAIGLNRSEAMYRSGSHIEQIVLPARLGYEASGIVAAVGASVSAVSIGDSVSFVPPPSVTNFGAYGEQVTIPAELLVHNPADVSHVDAAATWMAGITAYGGLVDIAGLSRGQSVLIQAASSSVGLAAIQIANRIGARPIATTRGRAKAAALLDAGAEAVIVTDEEDLIDRVMHLTNGVGVNVVFDPVAGAGVSTLAAAMAPFGFLVLYGSLQPEPPILPLRLLIAKALTLRGFTFKEIVLDEQRRERAKHFVLDGLSDGALRPTIDRVFHGLETMAEAHRYLESNQQFGKIVLEL